MLEGKDCRTLDIVFPFVAGFVDRANGLVELALMTRLPTEYVDLDRSSRGCKSCGIINFVCSEEPERHIIELKRLLKVPLDGSCETGLYTLNSEVFSAELFGRWLREVGMPGILGFIVV